MPKTKSVVIVTPVLNDWPSFAELAKDISRVPALNDNKVTLVAVDDGSTRVVAPTMETLSPCITSLQIVHLKANQGHQRAIALGLAYVHEKLKTDVVVVMDSDGEDVPAKIADLLDAHSNYPEDLIVAQRAKRSESFFFKAFYYFYKLIFKFLTGKGISFGNFSLIPEGRLSNVLFNQGIWNNFAATLLRSRIDIQFVPTFRGSRYHGKSSMGFTGLLLHGFSAISVFSDIVIGRIITALFSTSLIVALAIAIVIWVKLFTDQFVPGYATYVILFLVLLLVLSLFVGFLLILTLLSARDKSVARPTDEFSALVKKIEEIKTISTEN